MVDTVYTDPATLDLAVDQYFTDTIYDKILSDLKHIGGLTGSVSAHAYHDAAQSITNNAWTASAFNQERFDTEGFHDLAVNNSRLTVPAGHAGKYLLLGGARFAANATANRGLRIVLNGATILAEIFNNAASAGNWSAVISATYPLAVGDYVELHVFQNSGAALNLEVAANYSPALSIVKG